MPARLIGIHHAAVRTCPISAARIAKTGNAHMWHELATVLFQIGPGRKRETLPAKAVAISCHMTFCPVGLNLKQVNQIQKNSDALTRARPVISHLPATTEHKMKKILSMISTLAAPLVLLALALVVGAGCGQRTAKLTSDQSKAFDNAPAEVKQTWEKALAADKANDYVTAQTSLDSLNQMILSDPQRKALETEAGAFGLRLWQAAEKNDPAAVKAVQEINKAKNRRK